MKNLYNIALSILLVLALVFIAISTNLLYLYFSPHTSFFEYGEVRPVRAYVGETLRFSSTKRVNTKARFDYEAELNCKQGNVYGHTFHYKTSAIHDNTDGLYERSDWDYPYIPEKATTCFLETQVRLPLKFGIFKTQYLVSPSFDISFKPRTENLNGGFLPSKTSKGIDGFNLISESRNGEL